MTTERRLFTIPETAEALGLTPRTVYRLIAEGKLTRVYPTPGAARVTAASLESFMSALPSDSKSSRGRHGAQVVKAAKASKAAGIFARFGWRREG